MNVNDLKPGMFGLSGGGTFIQKAIKFFTRSDFSHSYTFLEGPYGVLCTIETTSTIVEVAPVANKMAEPDYLWIWEPIADDDVKKAALEKTYKEYSAVWYGYYSYLWFMYRAVCRIFGYEPLHVWDWASKGVTCTELTCYYIIQLGPQFAALFDGKDFSAQAPEELLVIIKANPSLFREVGWLIEKLAA